MKSSCAGWWRAHPGVLNDFPTAIALALDYHYVAAFGGNFGSGGDGRESFLELPAVACQISGRFKFLALEGEVTVEGGHNILEQGTQGGGAGNAIAVRLKEHGICCIKLQDRFDLFGAKVLHPGFADFGDGGDRFTYRMLSISASSATWVTGSALMVKVMPSRSSKWKKRLMW